MTASQHSPARQRRQPCLGWPSPEPEVIGATGFEPATFRPPAECAIRFQGCGLHRFPHSHAVLGCPSCPEFRADCALECAPGVGTKPASRSKPRRPRSLALCASSGNGSNRRALRFAQRQAPRGEAPKPPLYMESGGLREALASRALRGAVALGWNATPSDPVVW
jgi:hypothetical protein